MTARKKFNTVKHHDRSKDYNQVRKTYSLAITRKIANLAKHHNTMLDLATGTGILAIALKDKFSNVFGVDSNQQRIQEARLEVKKLKLKNKNLKFIKASAERLPFRSNFFDLVVVAQAFHWFDQTKALREIHRVLKPGGVVILLWKYPDQNSKPSQAANRVRPNSRRNMGPQLALTCQSELFDSAGFTEPKKYQCVSSFKYSIEDWAKSITWALGAGSGQMDSNVEAQLKTKLIKAIRPYSKTGVWERFIHYIYYSYKK